MIIVGTEGDSVVIEMEPEKAGKVETTEVKNKDTSLRILKLMVTELKRKTNNKTMTLVKIQEADKVKREAVIVGEEVEVVAAEVGVSMSIEKQAKGRIMMVESRTRNKMMRTRAKHRKMIIARSQNLKLEMKKILQDKFVKWKMEQGKEITTEVDVSEGDKIVEVEEATRIRVSMAMIMMIMVSRPSPELLVRASKGTRKSNIIRRNKGVRVKEETKDTDRSIKTNIQMEVGKTTETRTSRTEEMHLKANNRKFVTRTRLPT